jgi:16S rRNA (adenine1518-N6/adenine1519-N6)-dimethyltransferase
VRSIVRDAAVAPGDFVLEVGPGCGFVTLHLAAAGARLLAVEIDERLGEISRELVAGAGDVEFLIADALAGKHALEPELVRRLPERGPWQLVSNLPYAIATPLVALLARLPNPPSRMTVTVQKEAAERFLAEPGGGAWGPISVRLALAYEGRILRTLRPELFWPRPKVDSAVARLDLLAERPPAPDLEELDLLIEPLFQHRRKALGGQLADLLGDRPAALELCARVGVVPTLRPESLTAAQLLDLSRDEIWRHRAVTRPRKRG